MHVNDLLEAIKDARANADRCATKNKYGVSVDVAAAHMFAGIERQLVEARNACLEILARLSTDSGFVRNAIIGYKVPTAAKPRPAQPVFTSCRNCGSVDHAEYGCPCKCHGRAGVPTFRAWP